MKKEVGILVVATVFVSFLSTGCEDKIELKTFSADPPEFSPDGDGVADTTKLTVGAQASVTDAHFKDSAMTFSESVYIEVKDQAGNLVSTSSQTQPLDRAGALKQGSLYVLKTPKMDYVWNGKLPDGTYAPDGDYSASASAKLIGTKNGTPSQLDASEVKTTTVSVKKASPLIIGVMPPDGARILYREEIPVTIELGGPAASVKLNGADYGPSAGGKFVFPSVALRKGINAFLFEVTDPEGNVSKEDSKIESIQRCPDGIVKPEEGGIVDVVDLNSPINGATLVIYVNSLSTETTIQLAPALDSGASSKTQLVLVGTPIRLSPENVQLNISADLFVPYSEQLFQAASSISDELRLVKEGGDNVEDVAKAGLPPRHLMLAAGITSFGTYAPVAKQTNFISTSVAGRGEVVPAEDGASGENVKFDKPIKSIKADKSGNLFILQESKLLHMNLQSKIVRKLLDASSPGWQTTKAGALAVNARGTKLYIAFNGGYIQSFDVLRDGTPTGATNQENGTDGFQAPADGLHIRDVRFTLPNGIALVGDDELVVVDALLGRIFRVDSNQRIRTVAGAGLVGKNEDHPHPATEEKLTFPSDMEVAVIGKAAAGPNPPTKVLLFADSVGNRVRAVNIGDYEAEVFGEKLPPGYITTVAGKKCVLPGWLQLFCGGFAGDGGPAKMAALKAPTSVTFDDETGWLFVADTGNNRLRVVASDARITTISGGGQEVEGVARAVSTDNVGSLALPGYYTTGFASNWEERSVVSRRGQLEIITHEDALYFTDKNGKRRKEFSAPISWEPVAKEFTAHWKNLSRMFLGSKLKCNKLICGHGAEAGVWNDTVPPVFAGSCNIQHAGAECKTRTSEYYSSSVDAWLDLMTVDDVAKTQVYRFANRTHPGKDRWNFYLYFPGLGEDTEKCEACYVGDGDCQFSYCRPAHEITAQIFTKTWPDANEPPGTFRNLNGVDLGNTPYEIIPATDLAAKGGPKDRCFTKSKCKQKIHGSRYIPVDKFGNLQETVWFLPDVGLSQEWMRQEGFRFHDIEGTKEQREFLFSGKVGEVDTGFEGVTKRMKKIGADTISLQVRVGIAQVVTDSSHTDLVYFLDPCESQTPEQMMQYVEWANRDGIHKFVVELIASNVYHRYNEWPVTALTDQYVRDWYGYGRETPSNAEKAFCFHEQTKSKDLKDIGTKVAFRNEKLPLSEERALYGAIQFRLPSIDMTIDYANPTGARFESEEDYSGSPVYMTADRDRCDIQADYRVFNYACLLHYWAGKAQDWIETIKPPEGSTKTRIEVIFSLANDYHEVVQFLARHMGDDDVFGRVKDACPSCKLTVAPFINEMVPGQYKYVAGPHCNNKYPPPSDCVLMGYDSALAQKEIELYKKLHYVGINIGGFGACVEDIKGQCGGFARRDNTELFNDFGERVLDIPSEPDPKKDPNRYCEVFLKCKKNGTTFWELTKLPGCMCQTAGAGGSQCINAGIDLFADCSDGFCQPAYCPFLAESQNRCVGENDWHPCRSPGVAFQNDYAREQVMLDPPLAYLHRNNSTNLFGSLCRADPTNGDGLLRRLNGVQNDKWFDRKFRLVFMGVSVPYYELASYNQGEVATKNQDHQEQIDYAEALVAAAYAPPKPATPNDFSVCLKDSGVILAGYKSNFDDPYWEPIVRTDANPYWFSTARSYWERPYGDYLKFVFQNLFSSPDAAK
ncbi:MAG: hypothetical protein HY897_26275 [Deltaproteobacteria bacterium]|nr:hypothetical protein [Deltaproteobacteria bacterium]